MQGKNGGVSYAQVAAAAAARASGETRDKPTVRSNQWAVLAEEDEDDDVRAMEEEEVGEGPGKQEDGPEESKDEDGDQEEKEVEAQSEQELRSKWTTLCNAYRTLERDRSIPPELLSAAREQRDAAERKWRAAKQPHPLSKRLRWAEAELREALAKEEAHRAELADHLEKAERRKAELEGKIAVDEARTERKREALRKLHCEGGVPGCQGTERAARIAVAGIQDIAPSITSLIAHIGNATTPVEAVQAELRKLATSLGRVEEVLQEATDKAMEARGPARFDISGDEAVGGGGRGGDEDGGRERHAEGGGGGGTHAAAQAQRWVKQSASAPWKRAATTAAEAVEHARRMLQRHGGVESVAAAVHGGSEGQGGGAGTAVATMASGATTNDLAVAERRERELAEQQLQEAVQRQQLQPDPQQLQQEEQQRLQREQRQREEMARHMEAVQRAAEDRAAQEAREREELIAKLSPADLARAAEVHAQQAAVAVHTFGTAAANQMAGLVHQAHARQVAQAVLGESGEVDASEVNRLMEMSPEELAQHDRDIQERGGYW